MWLIERIKREKNIKIVLSIMISAVIVYLVSKQISLGLYVLALTLFMTIICYLDSKSAFLRVFWPNAAILIVVPILPAITGNSLYFVLPTVIIMGFLSFYIQPFSKIIRGTTLRFALVLYFAMVAYVSQIARLELPLLIILFIGVLIYFVVFYILVINKNYRGDKLKHQFLIYYSLHFIWIQEIIKNRKNEKIRHKILKFQKKYRESMGIVGLNVAYFTNQTLLNEPSLIFNLHHRLMKELMSIENIIISSNMPIESHKIFFQKVSLFIDSFNTLFINKHTGDLIIIEENFREIHSEITQNFKQYTKDLIDLFFCIRGLNNAKEEILERYFN